MLVALVRIAADYNTNGPNCTNLTHIILDSHST